MNLRTALLVLAGCSAACAHPQIGRPGGGGGGGGPREGAAESCVIGAGEVTTHVSTITIGLTEPIDPRHAPVARNDAERLVFRHLYEPPARIDCEGHILPQLAEKWVSDDGGRRWTFRLRDGAQFWDGAPVTAQEVVFGRGGAGYTLAALESRVVTVMLTRPRDDVPPLLADPALAVTKPAPDSSLPIGTGRYWVTSATTTSQEIRAHSPDGDTLVFRRASSGDARDLLDGGVDLLVTRDKALREYAGTLQNFAVVPLPWDRTYVFVSPEAGGTRYDGLEQSVRTDARRPEGGFWWLDLRACGAPSTVSPPATSGPRRILYLRSDPTARELASRLAALMRGVAVARGADDFAGAMAAGKDWGYVVALPRVAYDPCRAAVSLLPTWAATVTALVDTRASAIIRRDRVRWALDQDGTLHR